MKLIKILFASLVVLTSLPVVGQSPSYYDLTIEADSVTSPYTSASQNYAFVRSKRGTDGVNTTPEADALRSSVIQRIVLVFSEDSPEDLENREEYNMERWDNLILTYPELFQEKTKYKNLCQCTASAGGDAFKQAQGFYIYFKAAEKAVVKEEKKKEPEKTVEPEKPKESKGTSAVEKAAAVTVVAIAVAEPEKKTKADEPAPVKEPEVVEKPAQKETVIDPEEEPVEKPAKTSTAGKKTPTGKPRRAKDPKACRPAFYGYGDQDLDAFFKDNILLSKKQKKAAKKIDAELRLQLNYDGSIKKVMLICENKELKELIEAAIKGMNNWNAAVRGGVAIKSEVRMKLKWDKSSKSIKTSELMNTPKPNPKCKCVSDDEIFGS